MASSPASRKMEIILKLMRPGVPEAQDFTISVDLSSTVSGLKNQIQETVPERPDTNSLRVIYGGRQLADDTVLKEAFQAALVRWKLVSCLPFIYGLAG